MDNIESIFASIFSEKTDRTPSFVITGVDAKNLDKFKQAILRVKKKTRSQVIDLNYDIMSSNLTIKGTPVDLFYFGYYTKALE